MSTDKLIDILQYSRNCIQTKSCLFPNHLINLVMLYDAIVVLKIKSVYETPIRD